MSSLLLKQGRFETIGDEVVLQLSPIFSASSFNFYNDVTLNVTGTRLFTKKFRYSIDNGLSFTSYATLTNVNLATISADPTKTYYFQIQYIRSGSDATGFLDWEQFCLDVTSTAKALIHINKANYDAVFGKERFIEVNNELTKLSVKTILEHNILIGVIDDVTVDDLQVLIIPEDDTYDVNALLKTNFGNDVLKSFTRKRLDTYSGFESQ